MRGIRTFSAMLLLGVAACGINYDIHTSVAPDARFSTLRTFRVLPGFQPLHETVIDGFRARGYALDERAPDFLVDVAATARDRFEPVAPDNLPPSRWPQPVVSPRVSRVTDGVVVIEVLTPSRDVMWRGSGSAPLTDDHDEDMKTLRRVAEAVVAQFPPVVTRALARVP